MLFLIVRNWSCSETSLLECYQVISPTNFIKSPRLSELCISKHCLSKIGCNFWICSNLFFFFTTLHTLSKQQIWHEHLQLPLLIWTCLLQQISIRPGEHNTRMMEIKWNGVSGVNFFHGNTSKMPYHKGTMWKKRTTCRSINLWWNRKDSRVWSLFAETHVYQDIIAGFLHFDKFVFVLTGPGSWIGELLKNSLVSFSYLKSLFLKQKVKVKARGE